MAPLQNTRRAQFDQGTLAKSPTTPLSRSRRSGARGPWKLLLDAQSSSSEWLRGTMLMTCLKEFVKPSASSTSVV